MQPSHDQSAPPAVTIVVGGRGFMIARPRPVVIGGRLFIVAPPTEDEMRSLSAELARLAGVPEPTPDQLAAPLYTVAGCRLLAWTLTRRSHPGLRAQDFEPLIANDNAAFVLGDLLSPFRADAAIPLPPA